MVVVRGVMVILVVGNDGGTGAPVGVLMIKVWCWW